MTRVVSAVFAVLALVLVCAAGAGAHRNGCHSAHSCPSDHHTYTWYDGQGRGWSCAKPGAPEYDPSADTTLIRYGGLTYYCRRAAGSAPKTPRGPAPSPPSTSPGAQCHLRQGGQLPDPRCTPGVVFAWATRARICTSGYSRTVRNVSAATKRLIYARYGVRGAHPWPAWEVDHRVPLELGGSNSVRNLWPEHDPARKDALENRMHGEVCAGTASLKAAQRVFTADWRRFY
jgi:hypothetical protein